jgi:UDP-glucose 4-epimerase
VGYGRGYSVLDVIDVVKRVARVDFDVRMRERRVAILLSLLNQSYRASMPRLVAACAALKASEDEVIRNQMRRANNHTEVGHVIAVDIG